MYKFLSFIHLLLYNAPMKVLAVIVTYNRLNMLKECLKKIKAQSFSCDCLIVDNASTDDTASWCKSFILEEPGTKFMYENTDGNIGGAGGFNYGIKRAYELGYDYAWVMDDDAFANSDALEKLMDADKALGGPRNYGFVASVVLWTDGNICLMNRQRKKDGPLLGKNSKIAIQEVYAAKTSSNKLIPIVTSTFVSLLIPISTVKKVGLPIKEFFIWCDDIEYTRRISCKYNMPCYSVLDSQITHKTKNNTGSDLATDSEDRIDRYKYAIRNTNYYYRHMGFIGWMALLYYIVKNNLSILLKSKNNKLKRFKVFWKSLIDGFKFNPKIEKIYHE